MNKIIVANWKMNPSTLKEAEELFRVSTNAIVCPPFVYLEELSKIKSGAILGAQDIAFSDEPGQTGEVSGEMLRQLGVKYVIIGHSERRWRLGESDEIVNKKLKLALVHNFTPIVCIGEKVRDESFRGFLKGQIDSTFDGLSGEQIKKCLIAYEPVWAISTNPGAEPDTPETALESVNFIKSIVNIKVLYGGSVDSKNVKDFISLPEISGVLVGGASVSKEEFINLLNEVSK
ncbi:MAG: hypothetical protein A2913_01785 [Parcubacteria group bacterium RIFCSPLOWO2_01_FULL_40_65]|nr:MAG: hypothetical protein A2734_02180 [Parcubacteria group bacterium RIFCSPHIGHO2_01_FULL_40_30]OHB19855.1 MAG: hypothetical protein A3D40_01540 [Parcubacteria group bacterium RIFCSPHIGHO2_02_FULL_40_12]OHB21566.1 MAG: hypothetical protein A2913_01785 [Parcubacteria group bacterium RIFCSPLOWO2_01_FULL_40_65]OHB23508.1 MAG: hypothetical protein A3I22_01840 [Parcubacteria group bacterium RIFCSPLOWO2_02_FULL_40_12]OHB24017.1 MAG: hypothetical protein A3F96_02080 [Parcubacteria group bacterium R